MTNIIACPLDKQKETYIWPLPFNWENIQIISTKYQKWIFEEKIQNVRLICESIMWKLNLKLFKKKTIQRVVRFWSMWNVVAHNQLYTILRSKNMIKRNLLLRNDFMQMKNKTNEIYVRHNTVALTPFKNKYSIFFHFLFTNMLRKWCSPTIRIPVQHFSYKST